MKYDFGTVALPVKATEHDIRVAIAPILNIPVTSFRVEIVGKRLFWENGKLLIDHKIIVETNEFIRNTSIHFHKEEPQDVLTWKKKETPIVIGGGISGLSCAYYLAKAGAHPLLLEAGDDIMARDFSLTPLSGLGGTSASLGGTFHSSMDVSPLFPDLLNLGFPSSVKTDTYGLFTAEDMRNVCLKMKSEILRLGGDILCNAEVTKIKTFFGWPKEVSYVRNGGVKKVAAKYIVLATGHGEFLKKIAEENALAVMKKPIFVTIFIQQKKADYDRLFFRGVRDMNLPFLDSRLVFKTKDERRVYFEGGLPYEAALNCANGANQINLSVTLGKSKEIVSKLSVEVKESELANIDDLLTHINRREKPFAIPAESLSDLRMMKEPFHLNNIYPLYKNGLYLSSLRDLLPDSLADSLHYALAVVEKKMPFYANPTSLVFGFGVTHGPKYVAKCIQEGRTNIRSIYSALPGATENDDPLLKAVRGRRAALCLLQDV